MTVLSRRSFGGVVAVVLFSGFAGQAVGQGLPAPALTATTAVVTKQIRPGIFQ